MRSLRDSRSSNGEFSRSYLDSRYVNITGDTMTGDLTTTTIYTPTINGGILANDDITIQGTTHSTRTTSYVILQPNGGNVGIGTTAPSNILSLGGNSARAFWMERHTTANTAGNTLTIRSGGGDATVTVSTVDGSGAVTAFVTTPVAAGTGYSVSTGNVTSGGTGTSATVNITVITGTADGTLTQVMSISGSGVSNSLTLASPVVQTWSVLTNTCYASPAYSTSATYYGTVNDARLTTNINLTNSGGGLTGLNCLVRHESSGTITAMHGIRVWSTLTGGGVIYGTFCS